ncbi:hypothetical protein IGI04_009639 [Brassica rapa subsp. trilocularis]|uniref:(S)-ureidoglycine aminohydrolase cupin domain-containing protein n=2 Tax=Brassica TaxID=3705 RepID=A0ABQ7MXW6_BRACM|nr:hypothetical protein IGI04_009639 [Brassica rapa subsp. trilocularis]
MASLLMTTPFAGSLTQCKKTKNLSLQRAFKVTSMQTPLEELYNVKVEPKVSQRRLDELGVSRWSVWKTGKCKLPWDWQVDQLVYIEEGEVRVVPAGSKKFMQLLANKKSYSVHQFDWLTRENDPVLEAVGDPSRYQKLLPWES